MAEPNKLFNFNLPGPYQAELARIADQQRMAEMLQAQSQAPSERFSYRGIEARTPATAGLAKLLQGFGGAYFQGQAREKEKALGERYKTESSDILRKAFEAGAGTPAVAGRDIPESSFVPSGSDLTDLVPPTRVPEGQPGEGNIVQPAYTIPGRAAVAPNQQEMARLLMTSPNPAHEAFGLQQMQKNAQMQAFINAGNAPSAAPVSPAGGAMATGGAPGAAPGNPPMAAAMSRFGGPAGGQPMAVWMQLDPSGAKYTEQLAKDFTDQNKPTDKIRELIAAGVEPGSDAWRFALTDTPTQGGIWRRGADGGLSLAPGYAEGQSAVTTATKGAEAGFEIVEIPVTQADGTTILRKMTKAQAIQQLGGGAPSQSGSPLNLTAPTNQIGLNLAAQLDAKGQPFNIRVPALGAAGAPAGAPSGFGVSNPVQQEAQKAAATGSVKAITDKLESSFAAAQSSEERMRQVQSIRPILDLPLITGPGATGQMFLSQVANKMYGVANEESLANTRQLITGLAELSLASRGALKGQGTITEGEGALLVKAKSAPDSLTVPEYKRLFTLFEKQDKRAIEQHEDIRKRAEKAGIPNIDFWRVDAPNVQTGQQLKLSPAAQDAVNKAMGAKP
jgi:hypothetical protein